MLTEKRNPGVLDGSPLKLGIFGSNVSSGRTYVDIPERWDATWDHCLQLAQMAEEAGVDCMVPIARWKGYGGRTNPNASSLEATTWASGLLAATRRINVFSTIHVPLISPVLAAKQMATADQIGHGRFGVNLVCGWSEDEFGMFGVPKHEHDAGYAQADEWWTVVKRIWAGEPPFDFDGQYYQLRAVEGRPLPYAGKSPLMMNAAQSATGREWAIRHSDMHFDGVKSMERIADTKRLAANYGRDVQVWTPVGVVCRPSQREADEFVGYCVEHADLDAMGRMGRHGDIPLGQRVIGRGNYCAIGDPDTVTEALAWVHEAGFDGIVLHFVNYLDELPYFAQEVMPRLERRGLRLATREVIAR